MEAFSRNINEHTFISLGVLQVTSVTNPKLKTEDEEAVRHDRGCQLQSATTRHDCYDDITSATLLDAIKKPGSIHTHTYKTHTSLKIPFAVRFTSICSRWTDRSRKGCVMSELWSRIHKTLQSKPCRAARSHSQSP